MTNIIQTITAWIAAHEDEDQGATMVEYALMVALIAVACVAAINLLALDIQGTFAHIGEKLPGA